MKSTFSDKFIFAAGAALLMLVSALSIAGLANREVTVCHDPVFNLSAGRILAFAGALWLVGALVCLFGESRESKLLVLGWISMVYGGYRISSIFMGWNTLAGLYTSVSLAFHISPWALSNFVDGFFAIVGTTSLSLLSAKYLARLGSNRASGTSFGTKGAHGAKSGLAGG